MNDKKTLESMNYGNLKKETHFISCFSCFAINESSESYCVKCNYLLDNSNLDPLEMSRNEGDFLGKVAQKRPKLITVICVWIIFLPILLRSLALAVQTMLNDRGANAFIFFWFVAISIMASSYVLYYVNYNYFISKGMK